MGPRDGKKRGGQTPAALKMLAARGDRGFWSDGPGRAELVYSGSIRSNMVLELASILIELGGGNVLCRRLPEDRLGRSKCIELGGGNVMCRSLPEDRPRKGRQEY